MMMDELSKMIEKSDLMMKACLHVGDIAVGVMAGEKTMIDLKVAQIEADISPNYELGDRKAGEILHELKNEKKAAESRGDSITSEACSIIIRKFKQRAQQEMLAW
jgi:hypothetical protein